MLYFKVIAKCGHVGKNRFYRGEFYVSAESAKAAALSVRNLPRVKHHHKDAILRVERIESDEFFSGRAEQLKNPYFNCKNKQEQNRIFDLICGNIFDEEDKGYESRPLTDRKVLQLFKRKAARKADKHRALALEA